MLPALSPDGQWLAYIVFENSRPEIFVRPLRGGVPRQVTADGGWQPRWSANGREIVYRQPRVMLRVPIQTSPVLQIGKPEKLFDDTLVATAFGPVDYDVTSDGRRFLMVRPADTEKVPPPINIVTDWFQELTRRVPTAR